MEAVAAGVSASIVGIVIIAIFAGAVNGSVFWAKRNGLVIGGVVSVAMLLLSTAFMVGYSSAGVTLWSLPSLLLAFLASYTVALKVKMRLGFSAIWCSVIAFFITIFASVPYVLTFRINIFAPILIACLACIVIVNTAMSNNRGHTTP